MRPSQPKGRLRPLAGQKPVDEARREAVTASDPVIHVQLGLFAGVELSLVPQHRPPPVPRSRVQAAEGRGEHRQFGNTVRDLLDHRRKPLGLPLPRPGPCRARGMPSPQPQVLFTGKEHVGTGGDFPVDLERPGRTALEGIPELLAIVQVIGDHDPCRAGGLHGLDDQLRGALRQGSEYAA